MGYKTKTFRITDLADSTSIYLCSQSTWLNEVEVSSITARQVVEKAIASIQGNYFTSPYITRNFYRVTSTINEQYAHLSEAVFDIYHGSSKNNKHQLKLIKSRGTQNKAVTMRFYLGLSPQRVFQIDVVQQHKYYEWLSPEGLDNYIFRLAPSPDVNGKSTYKVEFDQIEGSFSGYKGYIIMDRQNFAIVHIDFNLSPKGLRHHQYGNNEYRARMAAGHTQVRALQNRLQVWYKPVEGKYYLSHAISEGEFKIQTATPPQSLVLNSHVHYLTTQLKREPAKEFSKKEILKPDQLIEGEPKSNDPLFWKDFTILLPTVNYNSMAEKMNQ